jgi:hypothetical protein
MLPEYFAIIGAGIASVGGFYYLYETIRSKIKPNRVTWFLWGSFTMIIFAAQRAQGVDELAWATFVAGLTPFLILLASFLNKNAYWKTEPRDYYLMGAAILGIILWALTDNPNVAILFSLLADLLAGLPTLLKAYKYPGTESWIAFAIYTFGFGLGILAIQIYTFENYAFLVYLFITNGTLTYFASRKRPTSPL